ncbi:hypothetical protein MRB53_033059 [Persea americana]|uniref:Uncharacterized protein n=1 Tax=Persea americana TaxID=3435 RepID=A0ACC2KTL5_PERAE|nr:hypothetical protein MRB53_033059 [Persea americana]
MSRFSFRCDLILTAYSKIVKCISQLCLQNWPTPVITWASTPLAHKDAVWAEFQKRYRWDDAHASIIQTIFWQKCAIRTKDNLSKERQKALQNAQIDHPGQAKETAAVNRASGAPKGNKAPGTYKGGSISQLQHVAAKEASSQGQPIHWLDVYVATRNGLPRLSR